MHNTATGETPKNGLKDLKYRAQRARQMQLCGSLQSAMSAQPCCVKQHNLSFISTQPS